ncbi:hypothetical protein C2G38_2036236 [Gigaspora rosea]|uniref:Alpha/beta hydrolase fold-3 domain-containing protein n=1 Tax=Gigaspora rosea TaxID=44941 RepID=A0A397VBI8_9GLOM|nr:hypothetical protein C2G38_2036236 [Gigaspora rosea]
MSISENPESPLVKSWDLKFQLAMEAIKNFEELSKLPIEQAQEIFIQSTKIKVPSNIIVKKVTLNERYRQKSRNHLEKGLKQFEDVIDEKWKELNDKLYGEWTLNLNRLILKKIVIAGESAGAGLACSMLLFLRDAGLPLPGGAIGLLDLTHSMPSFWDDLAVKVDILPTILGGRKIWPSSPVADEYIANVKALSNKIDQKKPTIVGHPSFTKVPRIQFYCANEALDIPYASPMLAESLGDLPPILFQVGRLRYETIFFSFKAAFPHKYRIPSYATKNFVKSPFKNPTKVILEVYDDMPHCWHIFSFSKPCKVAFERCGDFIKRVTSVKDNNTSMIDLLKENVVSPSI